MAFFHGSHYSLVGGAPGATAGEVGPRGEWGTWGSHPHGLPHPPIRRSACPRCHQHIPSGVQACWDWGPQGLPRPVEPFGTCSASYYMPQGRPRAARLGVWDRACHCHPWAGWGRGASQGARGGRWRARGQDGLLRSRDTQPCTRGCRAKTWQLVRGLAVAWGAEQPCIPGRRAL